MFYRVVTLSHSQGHPGPATLVSSKEDITNININIKVLKGPIPSILVVLFTS